MKQVSPTVLQLVDVIVPHVTATFVIRSKGLGKRFFRALTISEDQDNGSYTINAVEHIPEKESVVDNVVEFEPAPNTIYDRLPIITGTQVQQEGDGVVVEWSGNGQTAGVTYQVKVYRNDLLMDTYNDLVTPTITLNNLQPGRYKLEIRARNKNGQWSEPEIREFTIDYNITTLQATPELWSVRLNWTLPNTAGVGYKTQIWYSETDEFTTAQKLADVATPTTTLTHTNLELMQKYYYWARIEDAKGITGEPSNSVWCGPSTDEKLITDYLKGKVDETLISDGAISIAKFAKSIVPPRIVTTLPALPSVEYFEGSIVTYMGALYQNTGNVWKPMMDTDAINQEIDDALAQYAPNIPEAVTSIPAAFTGKNYLTKDGKLYVWNATANKYEVSGIDPELEKNVPTTSATVPTSFTGKNNIIVAGQMYSWNGTKYVAQFDQAKVTSDLAALDVKLSKDIPFRVTSIPVANNGYNNLVLTSNGQIYSWNGTKYVAQFDQAKVTADLAVLDSKLSKDIPFSVSVIPTINNGYSNLVLSTNGQLYTWNATQNKYLPQFDQAKVTADLTALDVKLSKELPYRVTAIPTTHNGYNNLVLTSNGQIYSWNGTKYVAQFDQGKVTADLTALDNKLSKEIPYRVTSIPATNNGYNNLILISTSQLYTWNATQAKYLPQFDQVKVTADLTALDVKLSKDLPFGVTTIPVANNGYNNLVLSSNGQIYTWNASQGKYLPQFDQTKVTNEINQAVTNMKQVVNVDLPYRVTTVPVAFNGFNNVVLQSSGQMYTWNGTKYAPQFDKATYDTTISNVDKKTPFAVATVPATNNGYPTLVLTTNGQLYTWNAAQAKYLPQFDPTIVDAKVTVAKSELSVDIPQRVASIPASNNGFNNLVLQSTGQLYSWTGSKYALQFDKASTTAEVNTAISAVSKDIPYRVASIPATYNNYNNLVLQSTGQMYSWNGTKYVIQFDQSAVEQTVTDITEDLVDAKVYELAADVPKRVNTIPGAHNGSNNLVLISTGQLFAWDGSTYKAQFSNTLTQAVIDASTIQGTKIANGTISTAQLAAGSVTAGQVATGAITTVKLAANAVTAGQIAANAVTATQLAANSVIAGKIASAAVTTDKLDALAVTADKIAVNAITAGKIAAGAVTADTIAAGTITGDKIAAGTITANKILVGSSVNLVPDPHFYNNLDAWGLWSNSAVFSVAQASAMRPQTLTSAGLRMTNPTGLLASIFGHKGGLTDLNSGVQVSGGETFFFKCQLSAPGALPTAGNLAFYLHGMDATGAAKNAGTFALINYTTIKATWTEITGVLTIPADMAKVDLYIYNSYLTGTVDIINPTLVRQASAELIVDGAVTAGKIAARAITAEKIVAGTLTSNEIAAKSISVDRLVVSSGQNLITDPQLLLDRKPSAAIQNFITFVEQADAKSAKSIQFLNGAGIAGGSMPLMAGAEILAGYVDPKTYLNAANLIEATEDERYHFEFWAKKVAGAVGKVALNAYIRSATGLVGSHREVVAAPVAAMSTSAWVKYTGELVIPVGAIGFAPTIFFADHAANSNYSVSGIAIYRKAASELIVDGAIIAEKIAVNAVTTAKIAAGAVTANEIAANTITAGKIAANTITAAQIGANTITAAQIAIGTITANEIATNAITAVKIAAGAVTSDKIVANSITTEKLFVSAGANLIPNPRIDENLTDWKPYSNPAGVSYFPSAAYANSGLSSNLIRMTVAAATSTSTSAITSVFSHGGSYPSSYSGAQVQEGDVIRLRYKAFRDTNVPDQLSVGLWGCEIGNTPVTLGVKTHVGTSLGTLAVVGENFEVTATIPKGVVSVRAYILARNNFGGDGIAGSNLFVGDIEMVNMTTSQLIVDGAITADKVAANAITAGKIAANAITANNIVAGTISATELAANSVTTTKIAAGAVTANEIAANAITAGKIAANAITANNIVAGTISATELAANSVTTAKIATNAVTANEIAANAITTGKIAANSVTATHIVAGTITATELASNSVTAAKIVAGAITANEIAANAITTAKIATGAVTANEIAAGTITANKIATNTITATQIGANTITAAQIAVGTITATEIAGNTITGNKIAARTIDAGRIIAGAITANELAANSITAAKVAAGAIGASQIAANAITADKMVIGLNNNLVPDPLFEAGLTAWRPWVGSVALLERSALMIPASAPATRGLRFTSSTAGLVSIFSHTGHYQSEADGIPVVAGEQFVLSADICKANSPVTTGTFQLHAFFYLQNGGTSKIVAVTTQLSSITGDLWQSISGNVAVPAAAVKMRLYIYVPSFVGTLDICNPVIFKRTTGELIVDGSITTDKLAANSITSAKILAGSIQAAHIAAGTITGDRIAANQTLTAPNISGGSANFGGGRVTITSEGVFSLRANPTSNVGLQINSNNVLVYDENGNLRVKIGKLS